MKKVILAFGLKTGLLNAIREHPEEAQSILVFGGVAICLFVIIYFVGVDRFVAFWLRFFSWFLDEGVEIVAGFWFSSLVIIANLLIFGNALLLVLGLPKFYLFGFF